MFFRGAETSNQEVINNNLEINGDKRIDNP
jgi:hypothetical protein